MRFSSLYVQQSEKTYLRLWLCISALTTPTPTFIPPRAFSSPAYDAAAISIPCSFASVTESHSVVHNTKVVHRQTANEGTRIPTFPPKSRAASPPARFPGRPRFIAGFMISVSWTNINLPICARASLRWSIETVIASAWKLPAW